MTTVLCPTLGLEIFYFFFQHASQRKEVCKQPGLKQEQWQEEPIHYVSDRNRMETKLRCNMPEEAVLSKRRPLSQIKSVGDALIS